MKDILQVTYRGWTERRVLAFDADQCRHEVTPSGHLVIKSAKGIVYSAAPGMWHEAVVIRQDMSDFPALCGGEATA